MKEVKKEEEEDADPDLSFEPHLENSYEADSVPSFAPHFDHNYHRNISSLGGSIIVVKVKEEAVELGSDSQPAFPVEMMHGQEGPDPSKAGGGEGRKRKRKRNVMEEGSLSSPLEHSWKKELEPTCNSSALPLCGSSSSEDLLKDVRKVAADASTCAEAAPSGKDSDETLSPLPSKRSQQHKVVWPPLRPEEQQSQQEGLGQLSDSVTLRPVCEASSPRDQHEKWVQFLCRSCFFASTNPRTFIQHLKEHKEPPPYLCPQCSEPCSSLSELLAHMYWHIGYQLLRCRFCTFSSLRFSSMVRHSRVHSGHKPCEVCQGVITGTLESQRREHVGQEPCQGQQLKCVSGDERAQRPLRNHRCKECKAAFYTRGHLRFHQRFHGHLNAGGDRKQSSECHTDRTRESDSDSQCSAALSAPENNCPGIEVVSAGGDFEQAADAWDTKTLCSGPTVPENSCGGSISPLPGNRPIVSPSSYGLDTVVCKEEPLFSSRASPPQAEDADGFHRYVEKLENLWPYDLCPFKTYRCQYCSYTTVSHSSLELHRQIHADEGQCECRDCHETVKSSGRLQEHHLIRGKKGCRYGCCLCADDPESRPQRDRGSSEDSEAPGAQLGVQKVKQSNTVAPAQRHQYRCLECSYSTAFLGNLQLHLRTHTGERPYRCRQCQMKFRTCSHLKRHQLTHLPPARLQCQHCDYSSSQWLSLKRHLASHECRAVSSSCFSCQREEPFIKTHTCEECGYSTSRRENLKLHVRIHSGEKPFRCSQCAAVFRTSGHLQRHLLTHGKLRCKSCRFSTLDEQALHKHLESHSKKSTFGKRPALLRSRELLEEHGQQHHLGL